jgi:predicted 3-demethylubiquinone-9 3-methyltransferase (glyoxalase superfamily)
MANITQKITPFLWFDNNAEEAMNFYVSVFNNSKISTVTRYGVRARRPEVRRAEWWPALQVHRSYFLRNQL